MTHETAKEKLLDLAYDELPKREARAVAAHAEGCDPCRTALARIAETRQLMSALPVEPAPERGEAILVAAAREAARSRSRPMQTLPPWLWASSIAAVALVAVGAVSYRLLAFRPTGQEDPDALLGRAETYVGQSAPPEAPPPPGGAQALANAETDRAVAAAPPEERAAQRAASAARGGAAAAAGGAPAAREKAEERQRVAGGLAERRPAAPQAFERKAAAPALQEEPEERHEAGDAGAAAAAAPAPAPPAAPAPAPPAAPASAPPAPEAAPAARPRAMAAKRAAPAAPSMAAEDRAELAGPSAGDRYPLLRERGALRGEVVTFEDCPAERWRKVETDVAGRVVRYTRRGTTDAGVPFEAQLEYGPDGALVAVRYREDDGAWRGAGAAGIAGAGIPAAAAEPRTAAAARADAAPRCRL